jgi:hypothetical protein
MSFSGVEIGVYTLQRETVPTRRTGREHHKRG